MLLPVITCMNNMTFESGLFAERWWQALVLPTLKKCDITVKNDILWNMDAQKVTVLVLLDLSAAFDTVRHGHLAGSVEAKTWRD